LILYCRLAAQRLSLLEISATKMTLHYTLVFGLMVLEVTGLRNSEYDSVIAENTDESFGES
jgi:hypothetical protein